MGVWSMGAAYDNKLANPSVITDPHWNNVILLTKFEGANGSTTYTDLSTVNRPLTSNGTASLSTAKSKFGTSSLYVNGGYALTNSTADLNFSSNIDFTIEAWGWNDNSSSGSALVTNGYNSTNGFNFWWMGGSTTNASFYWRNGVELSIEKNPATTTDTWHHYAATRQGTTTRFFYDGVLVGSNTGVITFGQAPVAIGAFIFGGYTTYWKGWIDEVRITRSVARYTATFDLPSASFPTVGA